MNFFVRILVNAAALAVTAWFLPGIQMTGGVVGLLIVAAVFGLINAIIKPIVQFFSLPITCLTLGLFTLVINAGMLLLTGLLVGSLLSFTGTNVFVTAFIGAIIISIVSGVLNLVLPDRE